MYKISSPHGTTPKVYKTENSYTVLLDYSDHNSARDIMLPRHPEYEPLTIVCDLQSSATKGTATRSDMVEQHLNRIRTDHAYS